MRTAFFMFVVLITVCVPRWGLGAELVPQNSVSSPPNTPPPSLNWKAEETSPVSTNPQFFSTTIYFCDSSSPRSRSNLRRWNKMCAAGCCWLIGRYLKAIWRKILANNAEANSPLVQRDTEKCLWKQFKVDRFCWWRKLTCCRAAAADSSCSFNSV